MRSSIALLAGAAMATLASTAALAQQNAPLPTGSAWQGGKSTKLVGNDCVVNDSTFHVIEGSTSFRVSWGVAGSDPANWTSRLEGEKKALLTTLASQSASGSFLPLPNGTLLTHVVDSKGCLLQSVLQRAGQTGAAAPLASISGEWTGKNAPFPPGNGCGRPTQADRLEYTLNNDRTVSYRLLGTANPVPLILKDTAVEQNGVLTITGIVNGYKVVATFASPAPDAVVGQFFHTNTGCAHATVMTKGG